MIRFFQNFIFGIWFLVVLSFSSGIHAKCQNKCQSDSNKQVPMTTATLVYDKGLVDATINNVPIGKVLKELNAKTGIILKVYDPAMLSSRVSAVLKRTSLEESIQMILKDFSYALYPFNDSYIVIMLSRGSKMTTTDRMVVPVHQNSFKNASVPKSLDEFLPILMGEFRVEEDVEQNLDSFELEQRREAAVVQRALDALDSEYQHLYKDALTQLIGINDPRATEVLIGATRKEIDGVSRKKAVDALWQHVVNLQFSDNTSIDALRQLSTDDDVSISSLALDALHEYEQH